jgi:hypothetical protein
VVRNNLFERIHADAVQFGSTDDPIVEGNVARDIRDISDVGEHNDFVQCFPGCPGLRMVGNDVDGSHQCLMLGGSGGSLSPRLVIRDNKFVRNRQICLNMYDAPGALVESNTIWDVVNELRAMRLRNAVGGTTGVVVRGNLFDGSIGNEIGSGLQHADFNAFNCSCARGPHDRIGTPTFTRNYELAAGSFGIDSGWRVGGAVDDPVVANRGGPDSSGYGDNGWKERGVASEPPPPSPPPPPADIAADARWTHSPTNPRVGQAVRLDGVGSTGDGPLACLWEFTNSSGSTVYQTRTGCLLDFTFQGSGTKWIRLRVTDADGDTDSDLHSLEVSSG